MSDAEEQARFETDEDWKAKAQKEKEQLDEQLEESGVQGAHELPEASLAALCDDLALRAAMSLAQMPHPLTGQYQYDPLGAKYAIDLLAVLEEKTEGNRSDEESKALTELLSNLRMAFVEMDSAVKSGKVKLRQPGGAAAGQDLGDSDAGAPPSETGGGSGLIIP